MADADGRMQSGYNGGMIGELHPGGRRLSDVPLDELEDYYREWSDECLRGKHAECSPTCSCPCHDPPQAVDGQAGASTGAALRSSNAEHDPQRTTSVSP